MNADLHHELTAALVADYKFIHHGEWLQQGRCPQCSKKELFTRFDNPWLIRCGRENKCQWEGSVRDLYPDLFDNLAKRYPPTKADPMATAKAYLSRVRGFDLGALDGCFEQHSFYCSESKNGSPTVRFWLDRDNNVYWERVLERVRQIGRKANFKGARAGLWWMPPGQVVLDGDDLWLVEGIFDAIALAHHGIKAASVMSCNNYPETSMAELDGVRVRYVWALDGDSAGSKYTRKFVKRMREDDLSVGCASISSKSTNKTDWNDLHLMGSLEPDNIKKYLYNGALIIAESAISKAEFIFHETGSGTFPFDFDNRIFFFKLDVERFNKELEALRASDGSTADKTLREKALALAGVVNEIADFSVKFLYYQVSELTDESWYYCRIRFPHGGPEIRNTFTGQQVSSATEFKKRAISIAPGAVFVGSQKQLDRMMKRHLFGIKTVKTIDFVGYCRDLKCYVFNDVAVSNGKTYTLNDEDYFDMGKLSVKSLSRSVNLSINTDRDEYTDEWINVIHGCFGVKGLVALTFWFGSLFAEQIRAKHKSFPFLEIVGEPASGKTTLIEFLWKVLGRFDQEGFDPVKSTAAAVARIFAQVANLPIVMTEGDRDEDGGRGFEWDNLKSLYNGRAIRATGVKNGGNDTREPPFRGAIVISQNAGIYGSTAILQRIIHLRFDREGHTQTTKAMAERLEQWPMDEVSGFLLRAVEKEAEVMDTFEASVVSWEKTLLNTDGIKSFRVAKNHAQLMALFCAMGEAGLMPLNKSQEVNDFFIQMALDRQQALSEDSAIVVAFWEVFEWLGPSRLDHSRNPDVVAVNLNHLMATAAKHNQSLPPLIELKRSLRSSKNPKFADIKTVSSAIDDKNVKCWCFDRKNNRASGDD